MGDLQADVAVVHDVLNRLGIDAVVVAHSGGGMTLSEQANDASVVRMSTQSGIAATCTRALS